MEYARLGSTGMEVSCTPALVLRASAVQVSALAAWGSAHSHRTCLAVTEGAGDGVIIGATKISHLEEAVGALSVKLTPEEVTYLEEPYVPHRIVGHQ